MTTRSIRQEIRHAEKELQQLKKQHGKLKALADKTAEALNRINRDGEPTAIMEARIKYDAARGMLTDNEAEQQKQQEHLEALTAQAEQAALQEKAAAALEDLEAAKEAWRKAASSAAQSFKRIMLELEGKQAGISQAYGQAQAAAVAAGLDAQSISYSTNWATVPGVEPNGAVQTEHSTMAMPRQKLRADFH